MPHSGDLGSGSGGEEGGEERNKCGDVHGCGVEARFRKKKIGVGFGRLLFVGECFCMSSVNVEFSNRAILQ